MEHIAYDILVLGSGGAGLRAAITAGEAGFSVGVISRGNPGKFTCTAYSAGVMAGRKNPLAIVKRLEAHFPQWEFGPADGVSVLARLRQAMWENGGIIRNASGLSKALNTVQHLVAESSQAPQPVTGSALVRAIECRSALVRVGVDTGGCPEAMREPRLPFSRSFSPVG